MKVILLKDVKGIGRRFEEKEVSGGHATNYLIPNKLAVRSDSQAAKEVKNQIEKEKNTKEKQTKTTNSQIAEIAGKEVTTKEKCNEQGHLFSKLTAEKISDILKKERGYSIKPSNLELVEPIKSIGSHEIKIKIDDKETHFTLTIEKA